MEYISSSRMSLYNQCPLSFKFKYIEVTGMEDETTDWYADFGTLCHSVVEDITNKKLLLLDQAIRKYDTGFPACEIPEKNRLDYYKQGREAIERKFSELQILDIVGVEAEFTHTVDFAIPPLHGFIDLIYKDEKGRLIVRDYKTSRVYTKSILDKQFQPYVYPIACKALFGEYPFKFEFDFLRFGETREFIVTERFIKMGEIKVKAMWNKMKSGEYPGIYSPFFCENFCSHRTLCPLYLKKNGG
jgi:hypothetical protein